MMTYRHNDMSRLIVLALVLAAGLLAGCARDVPEIKEEKAEISVTTNLTPMRMRANTIDNNTDLQAEGHFTCVAYEAGSNPLVLYIPTTTVDWNSTAEKWYFNNGASHYYWPLPASNGGAWPSLDFFGYMPKAANLSTEAPYIGSIDYTVAHNVTFSCSSLPMTNAEQGSDLKEFMFGIALGQNYGNAAAGVPLTFQHPFARINLQLAVSHPDITINSITFRGIYNNGSFTYNHSASTSTWVTEDDDIDFVLSLTGDAAVFDNNPPTPVQIGDYYIMIPQDWAGEIVVDADCVFWGEKVNYPSLTTTVPTNWQPGYSYTYTFNISPDDLKVNIEQFTEQW